MSLFSEGTAVPCTVLGAGPCLCPLFLYPLGRTGQEERQGGGLQGELGKSLQTLGYAGKKPDVSKAWGMVSLLVWP